MMGTEITITDAPGEGITLALADDFAAVAVVLTPSQAAELANRLWDAVAGRLGVGVTE